MAAALKTAWPARELAMWTAPEADWIWALASSRSPPMRPPGAATASPMAAKAIAIDMTRVAIGRIRSPGRSVSVTVVVALDLPARSLAFADGRQVMVELLTVETFPPLRLPRVIVIELPLWTMVDANVASPETKLPPSLRSVALRTRLSPEK